MPPKKEQQQQQSGKGKQQTENKKAKEKSGGDNEDVQRNQKLQAILLADSFTKTFRPITWEKPKVLLPLVNIPMLDLTLEFLSLSGVQEVFIFCVSHAHEIDAYVNSSRWGSVLHVQTVCMSSCLSAGDALREIDSRGLIHSDPFVLISGDVISNMNLKAAIDFHAMKRKEDSNTVMTVVMKPVQPTTRAQSVLDDLVVGVDRHSKQIVFFENDLTSKHARIPLEILAEHPEVSFHSHLQDCEINICSPDFLVEFSDNFDYSDIRRDFIRNQAVNYEVGKKIYSYELSRTEYAARVQDPRTYHAICRDLVTRWVYPLVPEATLNSVTNYSYTHLRRYVYKEQGVRVNRSAIVGEGVVMGSGTNIEANAQVERTIIGRNCHIGTGATITESHIWANSRIEAGAHVTHAIICDNVTVKKGARVGRGCILSFGVVIGAGVLLPDFTRVSLHRRGLELEEDPTESQDGAESAPVGNITGAPAGDYDTEILGPDGIGYVWDPSAEAESTTDALTCYEETRVIREIDMVRAHSVGCVDELSWKRSLWRNIPLPEDDSDDDEDNNNNNADDNDEGAVASIATSAAIAGSNFSDLDLENDLGLDINDDEVSTINNNNNREGNTSVFTARFDCVASLEEFQESDESLLTFFRNVNDMVISGKREGHPAENTLLEIKGYKFAQNKTFTDCLQGTIPAFLTSVIVASGGATASQALLVKQLKAFTTKGAWGHSLLRGLILDKDLETQVSAIEIFQRELSMNPEFTSTLRPLFAPLLKFLYDEDILTEEALLEWVEGQEELRDFLVSFVQAGDEDPFSGQALTLSKLFKSEQMNQFVEWLRGDEEDEDDEEEGDDEEDEEDEE